MSDVIERLIQDHRHFREIFAHLEEQLDRIRQNKPFELTLLRDIILYCDDYSDEFHHPAEDRLFQLMVSRDPAMAKAVANMEAEHLELAAQTDGLRFMLAQAEPGNDAWREHFIQAAFDYIARLAHHMQTEETTLFPAARRNLEPGDLKTLANQLVRDGNPLVIGDYRERYARLMKAIQP